MTAIGPQESHHTAIPLQLRNVDVEVHAIDPLDFESHVIFKDVGHRSWYTHGRALVAVGQTAKRPQSGQKTTDGFDRTDSQSARASYTQPTHTHATIHLVGLRRAAKPRSLVRFLVKRDKPLMED